MIVCLCTLFTCIASVKLVSDPKTQNQSFQSYSVVLVIHGYSENESSWKYREQGGNDTE